MKQLIIPWEYDARCSLCLYLQCYLFHILLKQEWDRDTFSEESNSLLSFSFLGQLAQIVYISVIISS